MTILSQDSSYNKFINAIVPNINRPIVKEYEKIFNNKAIEVYINPYPNCYENCCHHNVKQLIKEYGGSQITGYYLVSENTFEKSIAIYHSIWYYNTQIIDPTPFKEGINKHTFIPTEKYYGKYKCIQ